MPVRFSFRPLPGCALDKRLQARSAVFSLAQRRQIERQTRLLAVTVALALPLLRVNRAFGDEDFVGFRKSYYQEDDNRMSVITDTWRFNVGLQDNVRLSGGLVTDAISGATPIGAPPPSTWHYESFNDYYQTAYQADYNTATAPGTTLYNLYNSGLISYYTFTNSAAAVARGPANTAATAAYQALTNNPNYHNNKVPLTQLHDYRIAYDFQLPITLGRHQITPSYAYSTESDYTSYSGALNYSLSLNDKNTTLSTGLAHNADRVRDFTLVNWEQKRTEAMFLGLVQLFGPKAYLTVNASFTWEHGYLADPYRSVMAENVAQDSPGNPEALLNEVRPRHRNDQILYASWTQFITPANGSYELSYRFFHDTYGIFANTAELDWHQKIGKYLVISPSFRYYVQNAANFYYTIVPDSNNLPTYYSSDYRLSEFESFATGVTVTWRVAKHLSIDASYLRYVMEGLDGVTSQSAYPSANVFDIGLRIWF